MNRNPLVAFFLAFIPGMGHLYLNRRIRPIIYPLFFFGLLVTGFAASFAVHDGRPFFFAAVAAAGVWIFNMADLLITLIITSAGAAQRQREGEGNGSAAGESGWQRERLTVVMLSFIPGLGHFYLGLMNRGMALLAGFFGLTAVIGFVTIWTREEGFIFFLGALPIVWLYGLFDAIQLLRRKERGDTLVDRTFFEELDESREQGKKSSLVTTLLAIFPGAGHMYLGLPRRGLQLMAGFLLAIYVLDALRLSIFLFLLPIIWFFSFFDALQQLGKSRSGPVTDVPVVEYLVNHQKWIGIGLLALGGFYLLDRIILPIVQSYFSEWNVTYWFDRYFQTTIVSVLLIGGGLKLLSGGRKNKGRDKR